MIKRKAKPGEPLEFLMSIANGGAPEDRCIEWPFSSRNSYGDVRVEGKMKYAHRHMLDLLGLAQPSPDHTEVAHLCNNPKCVNPLHLCWATGSQNCRDKVAAGTAQEGEINGFSKITEANAINIYCHAWYTTLTREAILKKLGLDHVDARIVSHIKHGRRWGWTTRHPAWLEREADFQRLQEIRDKCRAKQLAEIIRILEIRYVFFGERLAA